MVNIILFRIVYFFESNFTQLYIKLDKVLLYGISDKRIKTNEVKELIDLKKIV